MHGAQNTTPIFIGANGNSNPVGQHARSSELSHVELVRRLEMAIIGAGLWVLAKVDAQDFVRRGGCAIPGAIQILAFHPRFMVRLLEADPAALLAAPLKFAVVEEPHGIVTMSWADQEDAFARYDHPVLQALGLQLAALCAAIADRGLGECAET